MLHGVICVVNFATPSNQDKNLLYVTLAVYEHKAWLKILADPEMTCEEKRHLAWKKDSVRVFLDGTKYPGYSVYH